MDQATVLHVHAIVTGNIARESTLRTDESKLYVRLGGYAMGTDGRSLLLKVARLPVAVRYS